MSGKDKGWRHWQCPKCGAKYESPPPVLIFSYAHKCGAAGNGMVGYRRVKT